MATQKLFEAERVERRRREAEIATRLTSAEHTSEEAFANERLEREQAFMRVKEHLDEAVQSRARADEQLRELVDERFATARNTLTNEAAIREQEDDEILTSLTRYVQKLQASMHIINSGDAELLEREATRGPSAPDDSEEMGGEGGEP